MDVLKIATAGSVDDGKSTLIGRLLYETNSLSEDKLEAIRLSSQRRGIDYPDLSLATDGLVAEREQGITIDVAHIYFSTPERRYIIADSPGHVEYTRNMITGTSTSQASIVLIDARNGVKEQTRRHLFLNKMLGIKHLIFAINKMDLVDYDEAVYKQIHQSIERLIDEQGMNNVSWSSIPLSALYGDFISKKTEKISWYQGPTLLELLNSIPTHTEASQEKARFLVQSVIRPRTAEHSDYRGYAGQVIGNTISKGDKVLVLPGLQTAEISDIHFFNESFDVADSGASCTLTLSKDLGISRGSVLVKTEDNPEMSHQLKATLCWLDNSPLNVSRKYYLQQGVQTVQAKIATLNSIYDGQFQQSVPTRNELNLNEVAEVSITVADPVVNDDFTEQPSMGRFVLIDALTNNTVALGLIRN